MAIHKTIELLKQLAATKQDLVDNLKENGIEASFDEPMSEIIEKAKIPQTYILQDEDGNEILATVASVETVFTATENDIRIGTVAASDKGIVTGEKIIPSYHVTEGHRFITSGSAFETNPLTDNDKYDFTKLQAIICPYAGSIDGSVAAEKVVINEGVYAVNSTEKLSAVKKDSETKRINFGITNESGSLYLLRYFTYKEIY